MEPGAGPTSGGMLDSPPPQPPGGQKRSLMDTQQAQHSQAGLGAEAANPQIVALQGLAMMEQGTQLLSSALPALAQPLMALMQNLKQVVPQAMADQVAGIDNSGAGAGAGGPGGGAPAPPPQAPQPTPAGVPVGA